MEPPSQRIARTTAADAKFLADLQPTASVSSVGELHKTNVLRLEVNELLQASRIDYLHVKWHAAAQEYLMAVSGLIEEISLQKVGVGDSKCPFPLLSDKTFADGLSTRQKLSCRPTGCFRADGLGMMSKGSNAGVLPTLDLRVQLPDDLWQPKDYLRHRYFDKRNAVVWHVAKYLADEKRQPVVGSVALRYDHADQRKPILVLEPPRQYFSDNNIKRKKKRSKTATDHGKTLEWRVVIHFGIDQSVFPAFRLFPNRCNLKGTSEVSVSQMYNQAILEDLISKDSSDNDSLQSVVHADIYLHLHDALILCQIWCLQRGLLRRHDGWTVESLASMLVYLYRSRIASPRMSPLQVIQSWWKVLTDTDWLGDADSTSVVSNNDHEIRRAPSQAYVEIRDGSRKRTVLVTPIRDGASLSDTVSQSTVAGIYEQTTKESPLTKTDPPTLIKLYERLYKLGPVLLDSSLRRNVLGRISPATIRQSQRDARLSLQRLHTCHRPFRSLFMTNARFWSRYDSYLCIPYRHFDFEKSDLWGKDRRDVGDVESIQRGLMHILRKVLTDRIREIQILSTGNGDTTQRQREDHSWQDSDEIPTLSVTGRKFRPLIGLSSPTGSNDLIIGISFNPDTCFRMVDRGPPADDDDATSAFLELWGEKAELRRFKDGAIVHAVVWNDEFVKQGKYVHYLNDDKIQGGIVERIIRYTLGLHFVNNEFASHVQFSLRDMQSCLDGIQPSSETEVTFNPLVAHRLAMKAFDSLSQFLQENSRMTIPIPGTSEKKSRLGIPLAIDAVEPLAPCLRYTELFPPLPHPLLGGSSLPGMDRVSRANPFKPILVQIRFGSSSKWPNDLTAIKAAKAAMLVQLLDGIDTLKKLHDSVALEFGGISTISTDSVDLSFRGYSFRIMIRADPELRLLQSLAKPTEDASHLLHSLTLQHVVAAKHHSVVHAVFTRHASASYVVRLVQRWLATHMLSGHFSIEVIELMVAYVYSSLSLPVDEPASVSMGFLRFLDLLANYDWKREPLVVDPQNSFSTETLSAIMEDFEVARGKGEGSGPPLFIISPSGIPFANEDKEDIEPIRHFSKAAVSSSSHWEPQFSHHKPEWVVLNRAVGLASRSHSILQDQLKNFDSSSAWTVIFAEPSSSFHNYGVLMRVDHEFIVDTESSSSGGKSLTASENSVGTLQSSYTRSMIARYHGPYPLRQKLFKNLLKSDGLLLEWQPVDSMIANLEKELGHLALLFYNHLCPEVVGVLWRPGIFRPKPFSAITSELVRPVVENGWQSDTLVTTSVLDILALSSEYTKDIVTTVKVLDSGLQVESTDYRKRGKDELEIENSESEAESHS